jgi:UDP-N-acetylglucosamine 2-epimerase
MNTRKVFIITERRADYSRFKPVMNLLMNDSRFNLVLCVSGIHLLEKSGFTINEIL